MRYYNLHSFEKHLEKSAPHNLCPCYLVLIGDDSERARVLQVTLRYFPAHTVRRMIGTEVTLADFFDTLQNGTLFGGESLVVLDECDKLDKKEIEALATYLEGSAQSGVLLLGAKGKTSLAKAVEKRGVVFDLSEEKPWEREKRVMETLFERAKGAGKRLSSDAAPLLLEKVGLDPLLLEQELDKLICYVGDRLTIERSDIFRISSASATFTLWQTAEALVWEGECILDPASFYALIPALRSQLSLGLKIASLIDSQIPDAEWSPHFPKMWPKTLAKRKEQVLQKGAPFFKRGLDLLFKIEKLSRTGSNQTHALLDLFRSSMVAYARR